MGHRLLHSCYYYRYYERTGGGSIFQEKEKKKGKEKGEFERTNCAVHERKLFQRWWIERNLALLCRTRHDRGMWTSCNPRRAELEKRSNYLARNACIDREHNFLPTRKKRKQRGERRKRRRERQREDCH